MRDEAEAAALARSELLSVITHDLRNPLSVIVVSTGLLGREFDRSEASPMARRLVGAIDRATDEMNRLISDLIDAGRVDRGDVEVHPTPHEPSVPIAQAMKIVEGRCAQHQVTLALSLPEAPLPQVYADPESVVRVVSSLVGHALRFVPRGSTITVSLAPTEREVRYGVRDDGPGLSAEQLALAFARRQPRGTPLTQGTGLDVYVAKALVEAHGSTLRLTSVEGQGSSFSFALPIST